jgi:hypothetical protein
MATRFGVATRRSVPDVEADAGSADVSNMRVTIAVATARCKI